jgi:hypothetical protein
MGSNFLGLYNNVTESTIIAAITANGVLEEPQFLSKTTTIESLCSSIFIVASVLFFITSIFLGVLLAKLISIVGTQQDVISTLTVISKRQVVNYEDNVKRIKKQNIILNNINKNSKNWNTHNIKTSTTKTIIIPTVVKYVPVPIVKKIILIPSRATTPTPGPNHKCFFCN